MNAKSITFILLCGAVTLVTTASFAETPLQVTVGVPPVAGLVERIGGKHVSVQVLAPSGQCLHDLTLSPKQMGALGKSRLLITVGMPFEERLAEKVRALYPKTAIVDAAQGIKRRPSDAECGHEEDGAADHACGDGMDPHVWLSPAGLKSIGNNVAAALEQADPAQAAAYRANLAEATVEIDKIAAHLKKTLGPLHGETIWVYHPIFGYLTDAYGLKQQAIESNGKAPSAKELRELIHRAQAEKVKAIFVEPQADQRSARLVADAVGGEIVALDPLAEDVLKNLDAMADAIQSALGTKAKQ